MAKRVAVIRVVMQGYYVIQVAELLNVHRDYSSDKSPFLLPGEEQEVGRIMEHSTLAEEGYGC